MIVIYTSSQSSTPKAGEDDVVLLDEPPGPGRAANMTGPTTTDYVGKILVPDIEQRHGYREYYVMHRDPKPGRAFGFKKPGER